jgi:hypothetical protein
LHVYLPVVEQCGQSCWRNLSTTSIVT